MEKGFQLDICFVCLKKNISTCLADTQKAQQHEIMFWWFDILKKFIDGVPITMKILSSSYTTDICNIYIYYKSN